MLLRRVRARERLALFVCIAAALLAPSGGGCGLPAPGATPEATASAAQTAGGAGANATAAPLTHGVAPGLFDARLDAAHLSDADTAAVIHEDAEQLHAAWLRLDVLWPDFEPSPGEYDAARVAKLDEYVAGLHAAGVKVLLTVRNTPEWASDAAYWDDPPPGRDPGYRPSYPMRENALPRFAAFAEFLARRYAGRVQALECWNEPNMWAFLYPQRRRGDPDFAARTYLSMLRAFSEGVRRSGAGARVVGPGTASFGRDGEFGTSPRRFARYLADHGAAELIDVYSHHAYTPGGSVHRAPGQMPDRPETTVTLGNLDLLLSLFPGKPFYISEYGYSTRPSIAFGWFSVSEKTQARYLRRAYAVAARYPQVELLVWYLVVDQTLPGLPADTGVYTGLRRADGTRKPSWRAYAEVAGASR
jgi:hypothetical protein